MKNGPSLAHLFGTDNVGRDVLQRTVYGVRTSEMVALAAAAIATVDRRRGRPARRLLRRLARRDRHADRRSRDGVPGRRLHARRVRLLPAGVSAHADRRLLVVHVGDRRARGARRRRAAARDRVRRGRARSRRVERRGSSRGICSRTSAARSSSRRRRSIGLVVLVDATVEFFGFGVPAVGLAVARQPRRRHGEVQVRARRRTATSRPRSSAGGRGSSPASCSS